MKQLGWKGVGLFGAIYARLVTVVIRAFKKDNVGLEIMGWLVAEGKDALRDACQSLSEAYKASDNYKKTNPSHLGSGGKVAGASSHPKYVIERLANGTLRAEVDLDTPVPRKGAVVYSHRPGGRAVIEKRPDGQLYVNGRKVVRYRSYYQISRSRGYLEGYALLVELTDRPVLNDCVLDFLLANREFLPEDWSKPGERNPHFIYFWGTVYLCSDVPILYVRALNLCGNGCEEHRYTLNHDFGSSSASAELAR